MKKGDKGTLVIWLQDALGIKTDGDFGSKTDSAVREFQEANDLEVDGEAGKNTLTALGLDFSPFYINGTSKAVEWQLPSKSKGFRTYNRDGNDQFGTVGTIGTLIDICEAWTLLSDVDVQIGNISRRRGGTHKPHKSHKNGNQVDVRPFRNDGKYTELTYTHPAYSQILTEKFIRLVLKKVKGATVLFNDPDFIKKGICKKYKGHDNHLHINFPAINYKLKDWQIDAMIADSPRKPHKPKMKVPAIGKVLKTIENTQQTVTEKVEDFQEKAETFQNQIEDFQEKADEFKNLPGKIIDEQKDNLKFQIEDYKPFVKRWLVKSWKGFGLINLTQIPLLSSISAYFGGEYWWIGAAAAVLIFLLTLLAVLGVSIALGIILWKNRTEIKEYLKQHVQNAANPETENYQLVFEKK